MFGRYPGRLAGDADNHAILKNAAKQPLPALPALFRQQGYRTVSVGKITHYPGGRSGKGWVEATAAIIPPVPRAAEKPVFPTTWHASGEFRQYRANEGDPFREPAAAAAYRKAYLGCVRYTDAQIGKLLAAVDASAAAKNTIVVLWGDHGFLLGEHAIWGKHCLFEEALHSPLIIRVPGQKKPGEAADAIVETIDVYPTLAALAGLPLAESLDGRSLVAQLEDPAAASDGMAAGAWQGRATLRTETHRLIVSGKDRAAVELYDHREDPAEAVNAAARQKKAAAGLRSRLAELLPMP